MNCPGVWDYGWKGVKQSNRWSAPCAMCGQTVEPGEGVLTKQDGRWMAVHIRTPNEVRRQYE